MSREANDVETNQRADGDRIDKTSPEAGPAQSIPPPAQAVAVEGESSARRRDGARPHKRHRLYVTIHRVGNDEQDVQLLQNVFAVLLRHNKGDDEVDLCIAANGHERVELELPDAKVRYCRQLHEELARLVGSDCVSVESLDQE